MSETPASLIIAASESDSARPLPRTAIESIGPSPKLPTWPRLWIARS